MGLSFQALEKKGISHLEEKELKERNKRIQEDNRLELQKVGHSYALRPQPARVGGCVHLRIQGTGIKLHWP
jgi:hypothetical protein